MVKKYLLFGFAVMLLIALFISVESLENSEYSVETQYAKGQNIGGWINIGLNDKPTNSIFSDSFGNSINLIDLLKTDSRHVYTCKPESCDSFYTSISPMQTKNIELDNGEEKLIGFNLNTNIDEIKNFNLKINSDAGETCSNQIKIDLLNNQKNVLGNTKVGSQFCTEPNYGCFDNSEQTIKEISMTGTYCQRITLDEAPGFKVGTWVKKESGLLDLSMELYKDGWLKNEGGYCDLPDALSQGGEIFCDINYLVTKKDDYYVCLKYPSENQGTYKIKGYAEDKCAFKGDPSRGDMQEVAAYQIFVQPKSFGVVGDLEIINEISQGVLASDLIDNYLYEKYNGLDCSGKECIIPIKIISDSKQKLSITGKIEYTDAVLGGVVEEVLLYDLLETPALIDAEIQKIFLDKGEFKVPNEVGNYTFTLNFDGNELFSKEIEIKKGISILSINPVKTASGLPTIFRIKSDNEKNIKKYFWEFGDDSKEKTTVDRVTHTYSEIGNYPLKIIIEDIEGINSSREFDIEVGSAGEILSSLISEKQENLANIQTELLTYDLFTANPIKKVLDLDNADEKISQINDDYSLLVDGTEEEYQELLARLLELDIPISISKTLDSTPLSFFVKKEDIDLDVVSSISGGTYDNNLYDEYQDSILSWNLENVKTKISVKEFSANYGFGEEFLIDTFKIEIINSGSEDSYLLIQNAEGLVIDDASLTLSSGYYSKSLGNKETLEIYTTNEIDYENFPLFVSPSISDLSIISGEEPTKSGKKFNWPLFTIILLVVLLVGFGVYLLLKKWYDEKYENYLFKDKNNLYNIVMYVKNIKEQGMEDKEIIKNLRKSKWSNEQINYVMKKYAGKKIGMPTFSKKF